MRIFVIAGELSGDRLGAAVLGALGELLPDVAFSGIGGPEMARLGLKSRFAMDELSVMGIAEIFPKYFHLKRRIRETAQAILSEKPDIVLTIDSPDFCFRVAALVKSARPEQRVVHYVAPSVWAWRPQRAARLARIADQVLCLLPFEPPYFQAEGLRADFVGHPVVSEPSATPEEIAAFRSLHGLGEAPLLTVLPGSRRGEVTRLLPVFADVVGQVTQRIPGLRFVLPIARPVAGLVADAARSWPGDPVFLDPRETDHPIATKRAAFASSNAALAASGTVSLELAAAGTPMVIAYDLNWFSWQIMSRMVRTDTVTLANLVTATRTIPEFLGPDCRAENIAPAVSELLSTSTLREEQRKVMADTMRALGQGDAPPGERAARAILNAL